MKKAPAQPVITLPTIEVEGYRVFRDRTRLELRPLTLLYGRNQAGKSTLLRLLPLLADSVFGGIPVLDLASPALMGASFKELGWLGPDPTASPIIRVEDQASATYVEIQLTDDRGVIPNRLRLGTKAKDYADVLLAGDVDKSATAFRARFAGQLGANQDWTGQLQFSSMLPDSLPGAPATRRLEAIKNSLASLKRIQWIAASRPGMDPALRPTRCCRPDGSDLPATLQARRDVVDFASNWLAESSSLSESISIGTDGSGTVRLELRRTGSESLPQHLAGEGARWLLPILLSACWAETRSDDAPTMLAIEEMEARLHPNLQLLLLERLLASVSLGIPCVLETHSIYVLRKVQLAIASRQLQPSDVAIYWVDRPNGAASAKQIDIQADGTLRNWHPETFEEEQTLSRKIFEARWSSK